MINEIYLLRSRLFGWKLNFGLVCILCIAGWGFFLLFPSQSPSYVEPTDAVLIKKIETTGSPIDSVLIGFYPSIISPSIDILTNKDTTTHFFYDSVLIMIFTSEDVVKEFKTIYVKE